MPHRQTFPLRPWRISSGRRIRVLIKHRLEGDNEPGRAETALRSVVVDECLLDGIEIFALHQRLDRGDGFALRFDCQNRARIYGLVVEQHSAGAAFRPIAHSLGASDVELIAEGVEQGDTGFKLEGMFLPIYGEFDRRLARTINLDRLTRRLHDFGSENRHGRSGNGGNLQEVATGNTRVVVSFCFGLVFSGSSCIRNLRAVLVVRKMN